MALLSALRILMGGKECILAKGRGEQLHCNAGGKAEEFCDRGGNLLLGGGQDEEDPE